MSGVTESTGGVPLFVGVSEIGVSMTGVIESDGVPILVGVTELDDDCILGECIISKTGDTTVEEQSLTGVNPCSLQLGRDDNILG